MNASFVSVSWLGIVLTTVAGAGFGVLWFTRLVPGLYITALGRQNVPVYKPKGSDFAGQLVSLAIIAATTAYLQSALQIADGQSAAQFGFFTGVGYLASMTFLLGINPNTPKPFLYLLINAPYFVLVNMLGCLLQVYFRA